MLCYIHVARLSWSSGLDMWDHCTIIIVLAKLSWSSRYMYLELSCHVVILHVQLHCTFSNAEQQSP